MGVDMDQFVAPGVDSMFPRIQSEITQDYRLPVLPVHFLSKSSQDGGKWWKRFCKRLDLGSHGCPGQLTRWSHAHPTWTFWALPFFGRWLRRILRDEVLAERPKDNFTAPELKVIDVAGPEDLLNVALWEDGATKQWCKFDIPDPTDFESYLGSPRIKGDVTKCKTGNCADIAADLSFQPDGIPKVFYSASHA